MDLNRNRIPEKVQKVHFVAICGTAMGALASMLKDMGFDVTGSDENVYPPMSTFLREKGIDIHAGYNVRNLSYGPDLVVVGNTVPRDNPEAVKMQEMGLNFCSMPQAVNRFLVDGRQSLVVAGTHGKTTTASILAWVLQKAGLDPGFLIGGILKNFNSNYQAGQGDYIVIEGDEYDTAFFDKGAKFLHYDPFLAILTGVEFDHADIFRDVAHVQQTFDAFISGMAPQNVLLACSDDTTVAGLIRNSPCRVVTYGREAGAAWRLGSISIEPPWNFFEVWHQDRIFGRFRTTLVGEHNLLNALSVVATAHHLGILPDVIAAAMETFEGIKRRQEVRGKKNGITVLDDFAHHPTAVKETVRAIKAFYPHGRLVAVFEPRTNSSMRKVFQDVYPHSFDQADLICIRHPSQIHKIPPNERFSSKKLVDSLKRRGKDAHYFSDTEAILDFLVPNARSGDVILIMSNGGFDNIHARLLEAL
jgi:UDP-N-acetylmuramate: L-alanyl-gamma-D-glutamyl-meso-diaminopimelate ligase